MEYFFQKCSLQQFLKIQVSVSTAACLKPKKASWALSIDKTRKTEIMEFLFLKCCWKFMYTISHNGTSLLGTFYIHPDNNAPFTTKNVNFLSFPWTLLGHSKKTLNYFILKVRFVLKIFTFFSWLFWLCRKTAFFVFLFGFSFTNIHDSQSSRGKGRLFL